jgi:hypothetical protein
VNQTQLRLIRDVNADLAAAQKQVVERRRRLYDDDYQSLSLGIAVCVALLLGGLALTLVSSIHW